MHRVRYLASFRSTFNDGRPGGNDDFHLSPWKRGACSECSEPVWFQPTIVQDARLVCWTCAYGVCA